MAVAPARAAFRVGYRSMVGVRTRRTLRDVLVQRLGQVGSAIDGAPVEVRREGGAVDVRVRLRLGERLNLVVAREVHNLVDVLDGGGREGGEGER